MTRRRFIQCAASAGAAVSVGLIPGGRARAETSARAGPPSVLDATAGPIDLRVARTPITIGGRRGEAVTLNGVLPAPLLRFREGGEVVLRVHNALDEDTSVHWHGILVPNPMDGVPQVNFPGIRPGETFVYRYPVRQYGTYWYHSHSAFQEQLGHYGPLVIEPLEPHPYTYDREHVIVLSDWTFEDPARIFAKLKKQSDYYNFQKRTVFDFFREAGRNGLGATLRDRLAWGRMRMSPTDVSDVTGATYTYLVNGIPPGHARSGPGAPEAPPSSRWPTWEWRTARWRGWRRRRVDRRVPARTPATAPAPSPPRPVRTRSTAVPVMLRRRGTPRSARDRAHPAPFPNRRRTAPTPTIQETPPCR